MEYGLINAHLYVKKWEWGKKSIALLNEIWTYNNTIIYEFCSKY